MKDLARCSCRIDQVDRIVADIGIQVGAVRIADRVSLQEAAQIMRVEARLVEVQAEARQIRLPGVLESRARRAARLAEWTVALRLRAGSGAVGACHDAARLIRVQPGLVGRARTLVGHDRFIDTGAMDVPAKQHAVAVVFGHEVGAVIQENLGCPRHFDDHVTFVRWRPRGEHLLAHPTLRIVAERNAGTAPGRRHQFVEVVVGPGPGAIPHQVAARIVTEGKTARHGVLVQPVGHVTVRAGSRRRPTIGRIADASINDLHGLVARERETHVSRRARQVVHQPREGALVAPGVSGHRAVPQIHRGAPRKVVIRKAGHETGTAVLPDRVRAVQHVVAHGHEVPVRPGHPRPVAGSVILVRQRAPTCGGSRHAAGIVPGVGDRMAGSHGAQRPAQQIVGVGHAVGRGRIRPGRQPVELVVSQVDHAAVPQPMGHQIVIGVVGVRLEVDRR